jgi:hypothetical protein
VIPHPTTETLLRRHGQTAEGRQRARQELIDVAVESARVAAAKMGLSLRCEQAVRWGLGHDCRNDGSTCLCSCHDPVPATIPGGSPT